MGLKNDSLIDTVFEKFPEKKEIAEQQQEKSERNITLSYWL